MKRFVISHVNSSSYTLFSVIVFSGLPFGGFVVFKPPRNSEGPPKNHATLNPIVKTVKKIAEFMMLTHQDVRKKGSKILKLCRFAIVLH